MNTATATAPETSEDTTAAVQPVKIIVLQRGWVVVGRYVKDGQEHVLTDASIVRRWGTTKGLGEIATGGPTGSTVLDRAGSVRAHELATVLVLDAVEEKWADRL